MVIISKRENKTTFELCDASSTFFGTLLDEFLHAVSMVMTTFGYFDITKHLFQFLNVRKFASVGCANVTSMACKEIKLLGWHGKRSSNSMYIIDEI